MSQNDSEKEDIAVYKVVMNHEEQYSIWPDFKEIPPGWNHVGKTGPKEECLAYIKTVWTDMRPLSLRKKMEEFGKSPAAFRQTGEANS
jgi:MbtH protein